MIYRFKYLAFGISLITLGGCGKSTEGSVQTTLKTHLSLGRRVARQIPTGDANGDLFLAAPSSEPSLVGLKNAPESDLTLWSLHNTEEGEDIQTSDLSEHSRWYVDSQYALYKVRPNELSPEARIISINDKLTSVSFARFFQDIPVRDAYIEIIYAKQSNGFFRLREVVNSTHGEIVVSNLGALGPNWDDIRALFPDDQLELVSSRSVIYSRDFAGSKKHHSLATEFTTKDSASSIVSIITVEHESNQILEAYQNLYSANPLVANVFKRSYLDTGRTFKPLPLIQVNSGNAPVRADLDGRIDLGNATNLTLLLTSGRGQINLANANTAYQITGQVTSNDTYSLNPSGDALTALNTYTALLEINSFARKNINPDEAPILGQNTVTRFNVRGNCNAFYDPQVSAISLFAAGNGCANVAQINDVIYHEWGHGLDNFTGKTRGITDGAFSEGIGDIISAYRTGSSVLAPGFLVNDATGIRNLDNNTKYPDDQGEVHAEGQIIGGAFWDMRKALIERHGQVAGAEKAETIFFRHLLTTDAYLDSYQAALRLDDDDGNPATPSPNQCLINAAFTKHGLADNENCQDKQREAPLSTDLSISVGIAKADEAGFLLMASSEKAVQMSICFDTKEACLLSGKQDATMEREGSLNGKTTFLTGQLIKIKPLQTLTFIGRDAKGKPVGARMVRLISK
jgi:hypothetical protein